MPVSVTQINFSLGNFNFFLYIFTAVSLEYNILPFLFETNMFSVTQSNNSCYIFAVSEITTIYTPCNQDIQYLVKGWYRRCYNDSRCHFQSSTIENRHVNDVVVFFLPLFITEESFYNYIIQFSRYLLTFFSHFLFLNWVHTNKMLRNHILNIIHK